MPESPTLSEPPEEGAPPLRLAGDLESTPLKEPRSPSLPGPSQALNKEPEEKDQDIPPKKEEDIEIEEGSKLSRHTSALSLQSAHAPSTLRVEVLRKRAQVKELRLRRELEALNTEIEGVVLDTPIEIGFGAFALKKNKGKETYTDAARK
ncbi:hypothetical protein H2200_001919 [Cladophialophora chaetospira]|uniref:Uncharacterized protein n=1 Tax=Cladophialophora chaetospira TaxID=386627 RepID=A0AA38XLS8_9EURO|nr:hypothetical protein H2200_001919 [Cladophialophora chaetospira]